VSDTKFAIAALMGMTISNDRGPDWLKALIAVMKLALAVYLAWYLWRGAEPIERKSRRDARPVTYCKRCGKWETTP
jgi:hypothetical protein